MTRRDANLLLDGALLVGGAVALLDNAFVHWVLGWHRLVEGWAGTLYAEIALSVAGAGMLVSAFIRLRRHTSGVTPASSADGRSEEE